MATECHRSPFVKIKFHSVKKTKTKQWPFFLYTEQFTHLCRIKIFFFLTFWRQSGPFSSHQLSFRAPYWWGVLKSHYVTAWMTPHAPPPPPPPPTRHIQPKPAGQHWFPFRKIFRSFPWAPINVCHTWFFLLCWWRTWVPGSILDNTSEHSRSFTPISRKWSLRRPSPSSRHLQACGRGSEKSQHWNMPDLGESTRWRDERGTRGWKVVSAARLSGYMTSSESRP